MKRAKKFGIALLLGLFVVSTAGTVQAASFNPVASSQDMMRATNGWVKKGSYWYYYQSGKMLKNKWLTTGGKKYFLKADGKMAVGWTTISGKKYYFDNSGAMVTGWIKGNNCWYYTSLKTGAMFQKTFVKNSKGVTYYFLADGKMAVGWHHIGKGYRYFSSDGVMAVGWKKLDNKWYYFNGAGIRRSGLVIDKGKRYYMDENGVMQTGWMTVNGNKYYANKDGSLAIGWVTSGLGNTYYFGSTGKMATGLTKIGGKYYYFDAKNKGIMVKNDWVGEKYFGKDGAYIPGYQEENTGSGMRWPLDNSWSYISSYFGNRESPGGIGSTNHQGIDIPANTGSKIYAAADGTVVVRQANNPSAGNWIEINHANGTNTVYMHMSRFGKFMQGDKVKKGQVIGYVGNTGNSTGPHLHFGVRKSGVYVDPLKYVKQP